MNRILFDQQRAVGIEYVRGGQRRTLRCGGEILVAAGAFGSPKAELSGIGPERHLRTVGIPVRVDLRGVGQNLP